jgi:hypothetical protein
VYPQSTGMGVGGSVVVKANFATTCASLEKQLDKRMACCSSDGFTACELKIADKRTATVLIGDNGKAKTSLLSYLYVYEK